MKKENYTEIMDELYVANVMLEMCRGYAISEMPCMSKLGDALYEVSEKYENIYTKLRSNTCLEKLEDILN